jgi:Ca-activated chloride channel family protein
MIEQKKKRPDQPGKSDKEKSTGKNLQSPKKSYQSDQKNAKTNPLKSQKPEQKESGNNKASTSNTPGNKKSSNQKSAPNTLFKHQTASKNGQNVAAAEKPIQAPKGEYPSDKILNRLQDVPGRAMMPFYHKKEIEKDW